MHLLNAIRRGVTGGLLVLACLVFLFPTCAEAQSSVSGTVLDAETGDPLSNVNVFLDGTTIGAATNEQGRFNLTDVPSGSYTVVASRVGYQSKTKNVRFRDTTRTLTFELQPRSINLRGVTVEGSRDEWLDRLDRFRSAFFGNVRQAQFCELINPEVLSFQETDVGLLAHAKRPLRIRNEALGYEVTYHVSRFTVSSDTRRRRGYFEFEPLAAEGEAQRQKWAQARRRTYKGSFRHFVHALEAGALESEGFEVYWTSMSPATRDRELGSARSAGELKPVSEASDVTESARTSGQLILTIPRGEHLEVRFVREGESQRFARRFPGEDPRSQQVSWIGIFDGTRVLIDTQSGDFVRRDWMGFGTYVLRGYWGWAETAATALPSTYRPPGAPGK